MNTSARPVGDLCAAECKLPGDKTVILISIYISPKQKISDIIDFFNKILFSYSTKNSSEIISLKDYQTYPILISGDFNVNFSKPESKPLIDFLLTEFHLKMSNNSFTTTTRRNTTIDAVFTRGIDNLTSHVYASYFSYHKPIITIAGIADNNDVNNAAD